MQNKRELGYLKETKAIEYLKKHKIKILKRNYYAKTGEIDIIGKEIDTIVFFEVKYRKTGKFGFAQDSITKDKKKKLFATALCFLSENNIKNINLRFDGIFINNDTIEWIKNIIWSDEIE